MTTILFRRPARQSAPPIPAGDIALIPPPAVAENDGDAMGSALQFLPMGLGSLGSVLMFTSRGASPQGMLGGGMLGLSSIGMGVAQFGQRGGQRKRKVAGDRRDYLRYLDQLRKQVGQAAAAQRAALCWTLPDPAALWQIADSPRLWERRAGDEDFGDVRVATGRQRLAVRLEPPETKPFEDLDPLCSVALRRFIRAHSSVEDLPLGISTTAFGRIVLTGDRDAARGLARAMVAHLATLQGPDELVVAACTPAGTLPEWDWIKWLPHSAHPDARDAAGPLRLITDAAALDQLISGFLRDRGSWGSAYTGPHVVIVVDGDGPAAGALRGFAGVTVLDVSGTVPDSGVPALRLDVSADALRTVGTDPSGEPVRTQIGVPDTLTRTEARALARTLARFRLPDAGGQTAAAGPVGFSALLGIGDPRRLDPVRAWRPRPPADRLRVPIGVDEHGAPVALDIKESAQGGFGPHGLVVGATGSGKSELLRTLVLGLAATHSSAELNLVLVDFKGGATFAGLADLPHTAAVITNLADELTLVDRMRDALHGEMVRRQELLRAAGNFASLLDYEQARARGAALEALPSLFIVVDEFSELLSSRPDFSELFVMIGRLGRSLGVHLLLASQRLEEGRLRGLETHLSYRIGLRTFSASESRLVLGVGDAYELPRDPGHGYLKFDTQSMVRFRAAYVSGPYIEQADTSGGPARTQARVVTFSARNGAPVAEADPVRESPVRQDRDGTNVLDLVVAGLKGKGPAPHRVWLPPLDAPYALDTVLQSAPRDPAGLRVPVGVVDLPFEQRRDLLWADLSAHAGHVGIAGAPQTGKSTLVRTLMAALAATHSPRDVQFYCLDLGGSLGSLSGLPHVGGIAGRLDGDRVRRTVAEVTAVLTAREAAFARAGVDSIATHRARRAAGEFAEDAFGDVFLIVDGWLTLRQEYEDLEQAVTNLAARGLGYGVHVVVTAGKWSELRPSLRDVLGTRYELRLGDPMDSTVGRQAAAAVPAGRPGRGLTAAGRHFLAALPRLDGVGGVEALAEGTAKLVAEIGGNWPGASAPQVRMLPDRLPWRVLPPAAARGRIPFALSEETLAPLELEFDRDPHLLVIGDTEAGKTNLLRLIIGEICRTYSPEQARLVVADYRRALTDAASPAHLLGHAASGKALAGFVPQIAQAMRERLDDPAAGGGPRQRPDLFVIADDHDLTATGADNPLAALADLLPQARDIGLHLIVARRAGGAARAMFEPVIARLKETGSPLVLMSCPKEEGAMFTGIKPRPLPVGRAQYVTRGAGLRLVQTALYEEAGQ
ncbi:type VII secretion protein EccCa [Catenulispora pinistramenti]|uniref:type VII secretion protein EccCa n=1 Tax=Catenulispora pinistramenti TaxID=2705254 RepID=UPI002E7A4CA1|nr:type VII secretion protein EccCa [Catenulispora pinistramenti]